MPTSSHYSYSNRLDREIFSYPLAGANGGIVIDLGNGDGIMAGPARQTQLDHVSLYVEDGISDIIGDAHRLPFADGSIDFILAFSVLEHLRYPSVDMGEIARGNRRISLRRGQPSNQ